MHACMHHACTHTHNKSSGGFGEDLAETSLSRYGRMIRSAFFCTLTVVVEKTSFGEYVQECVLSSCVLFSPVYQYIGRTAVLTIGYWFSCGEVGSNRRPLTFFDHSGRNYKNRFDTGVDTKRTLHFRRKWWHRFSPSLVPRPSSRCATNFSLGGDARTVCYSCVYPISPYISVTIPSGVIFHVCCRYFAL